MNRHDRESITATALTLLDRLGLPDLSMRRLATELGVQPSALYWHFANKQELLAAVADRILATAPDAAGDYDRVVHGIRDALLRYRDGAEVVASSLALGLGADDARRLLRTVTSDAATADALFAFILGHVMLEQQRMHAQSIGAVADTADDPSGELDASFRAGVSAFSAVRAR